MQENISAKKIRIKGIVQGVGFRPFIFRLANQYGLRGEVANTSNGVSIHIEGKANTLESFCEDLLKEKPLIAHITHCSYQHQHVKRFNDFSISKSKVHRVKATLISPDISICNDCKTELFNPKDRRFNYPFINCTNCGPRYTIIEDIPYDRAKTSMKQFKMCNNCQKEYNAPINRRFHAQPNACDDCGPQMMLLKKGKNSVPLREPLKKTVELLRSGYIVAIKGLGGFHLAVDAKNNKAVSRLRKRKNRAEKPLAIMAYDMEMVSRFASFDSDEEKMMTSHQRPIVILKKKSNDSICESVSSNNTYGVMLPYTAIHYILLRNNFTALVMTSGNISREPITIDNNDALRKLSGIADYFLMHNRDIYLRSDDSIVRKTAKSSRIIRRSRGYVPSPIYLQRQVPRILACGAELKNTICLTKNNNAFLSQHIGDMENLEALKFFKMSIKHMKQILNIRPEIIAYDLHPDYLSTRYAMEQKGIIKMGVQHHHAHIVSCMAENRIAGKVIGLAFDGTGYGTDGNIWGSEVLLADETQFVRKAHFDYAPMPGSAAAIKEPWRMGLSYLIHTFGKDIWSLDIPFIKNIGKEKITVIHDMIKKRINAPLTSGLGRLFDGIAAILGIRQEVNYEGQAAIELETAADDGTIALGRGYTCSWKKGAVYTLSFQTIINDIINDLKQGINNSVISARFHLTVINVFADVCECIRSETDLNRICLSGGVFQNSILLSGLTTTLKEKNFDVYAHSLVPFNDGGLALGQAIVAANMIEKPHS